MYTTNAIESINSSFRKVTRKGSFANNEALMKLLYLRVKELQEKKWKNGRAYNWHAVMAQLSTDERMSQLIAKYERLM